MSETKPTTPAYSAHAVHLLRTAVQAHMMLSQMADQKAGMLMAATFVVFTIAIGQAGNGNFVLALVILGLFAFLSAICAILAVLPAVHPSEQVGTDANLLFFGAFSQLSEAEFADRLLPLLTSDEAVFRTMLRDLHQNGQVLQRKKYRYLGYAYRLFLAGLILAGAAVLVEYAGGLLSLRA